MQQGTNLIIAAPACREMYKNINETRMMFIFNILPQQMLVHKGGQNKGGQINNVQLITGVKIAEM